MRILPNFNELLPPLEDDDDSENPVRPPELGGSGISLILFYKWWDDALPSSDAVWMRDVAVYARTVSNHLINDITINFDNAFNRAPSHRADARCANKRGTTIAQAWVPTWDDNAAHWIH